MKRCVRSWQRSFPVAAAVCALSLLRLPLASAQQAGASSAREHFQRGYDAAQHGQLDVAITEFELAYAERPHFSVLYNLGQAYASAGRAVEAVDSLTRYLELGASEVPTEREKQVRALIEFHSGLIGELELDVSPAGAEISLDGKPLGVAPLPKRIRSVGGVHGLAVTFDGYVPATVSVRVTARGMERLSVALTPLAASAELRVRCAVPDVSVELDGRMAGRTPLSNGIPVSGGEHRVRFLRAGYLQTERTVRFEAGKRADVECALTRDPANQEVGALAVLHPEGTRLTLDGADFRGGMVPAGRHTLAVSGAGYQSAQREIVLVPRSTQRLSLIPAPTRDAWTKQRAERARTQRLVSYVLGGAGIVAAGTAGVLYIANNQRYADWRDDSRRFISDYARDPTSATPSRLDALITDENAIRNRDNVALGLGVLAGALLAAATGLYLTAETPAPRLTLTSKSADVAWQASW